MRSAGDLVRSSGDLAMRLKDDFFGVVSDDGLDEVPVSFSLVGDVAVISIPPELEGPKNDIGRAIISNHKGVKTILQKVSKLEGERRVASFEVSP